jgi:hypothetical protein
MDDKADNLETTNKRKDKFPWPGFLIFLAMILLIVGLVNVQSCSTKNGIEKYAREQLLSRNYTVLDLTVVESHSSSKTENEGGKVKFTLKDKHGLLIEGKADIGSERHWLVWSKKVFIITSLKPKK